jgi:hypothetical protein
MAPPPGPPYDPRRSLWSYHPLYRDTRRTDRVVLIVLGVGLALMAFLALVTIGTVTLLGGFRDSGGRPTPEVLFVRAFVDSLSKDRISAAYGQLCAPTRQRYTVAAFGDYVHAHRKVRGWSGESRFVADDPTAGGAAPSAGQAGQPGQVGSSVTLTVDYDDGTSEEHRFPIVVNGNDIRICGDPY